ncbi:MAG: hypothetical protein GY953_05365 [bacterium]|nr:hypothetical protein [bacterium]
MTFRVLVLAMFILAVSAVAADWFESDEIGLLRNGFGELLLDGKSLPAEAMKTEVIGAGHHLATGNGFAEVALTPGNCLRLGRLSEFELVSAEKDDVRLSVVAGSAIIDVSNKSKEEAITVASGGAVVHLMKEGLYRVDAVEEGGILRVKVVRGQAKVVADGAEHRVKGKQMFVGGGGEPATVQKAGRSKPDELESWSKDRTKELKKARAVQGKNSGDLLRDIPFRTF